ncbi:MAG: prealbumin-like fold domain-containing protein [Oscillospiraceae bacterium]|nr:prealbumin-like fold domain-containing protein [Oscillospiraceae bacterium]
MNGAVFEVRSRTHGDLMDTITTNAQGFAQTKELPLGQYHKIKVLRWTVK